MSLRYPTHEGLRGNDGREPQQAATPQELGPRRQLTALGIGEPKSLLAEMLLQHSVFVPEVRELSGLVAVEPATDADEHEVEEPVFHEKDSIRATSGYLHGEADGWLGVPKPRSRGRDPRHE